MESSKRYIVNKFPDTPENQSTINNLQIHVINILRHDFEDFVSTVKAEEVLALASVPKHNHQAFDCFEGAGSYLILYVKLLGFYSKLSSLEASGDQGVKEAIAKLKASHDFNQKALLSRAETSLEKLASLVAYLEPRSSKIRISYFFGGANVFLNGCLLSYIKKDAKGFSENLQNLLAYKKIIQSDPDSFYKEILYGVAGYLYNLLALQAHNKENTLGPDFNVSLEKDVGELVEIILDSGIKSYGQKVDVANLPKDFRLMYSFHEREYFGGAHGLFGILYTLLRAYQLNEEYFTKENRSLGNILLATVKASLKFVLRFQFESGNFPSSEKRKTNDELVQFCHGSPGAIACLLIASEIYKDELGEKCRQAAILAGENVWKHGILKKGYGLCHGISGNGYGLLTLYRYTKDAKWLYKAYCFINAKLDSYYMDKINSYEMDDRYTVGKSDYPYSLMLGLAGDIYFQADSLFPETARFPGYEV